MQKPTAIITGAGRGIGRATAIALAQRGYGLTLISRTRSDLEQTRDLCGAGEVCPMDVANPTLIAGAVESTFDRGGRLDAIVHCAGLAPVRNIPDTSIEEWRAVLEVNLSAAFYLLRSAWPIFARQKQGVAVNVSSAAARDPFPGFAAYSSAKAGLHLLGLSAAREGEKIGVRVHTIAPAAVETGMLRQILSAEQYPTERTLDPADVASVIAACVVGDLRYASGEVIYLHKQL